ncbi:MAG TPA: hypothetical protein VHW00_14605 [Thermoanaerobaculia bacterium]|nr:hypothetical protein [Thermoanaerobaculia bacterium]
MSLLNSERFKNAIQELADKNYDECCSDQAHVSVYMNDRRVIVPWERIDEEDFGSVLKDLDALFKRVFGIRYRHPIDPR